MQFLETPSPNYDTRSSEAKLDMLILHYTGLPTVQESLDRLCDPESKVSAHYLISETGEVHALVPESCRAWHAGAAFWRGDTDINSRSIGIELQNPGHEFGYRAFPKAQMESLIVLCLEILDRHPIPARHVLGHSDVAPDRKEDPGDLFDWAALATAGIGLWPMLNQDMRIDAEVIKKKKEIAKVQTLIKNFGYEPAAELGQLDDGSRVSILAFQRHFQPHRLTGLPDQDTLELLEALLAVA